MLGYFYEPYTHATKMTQHVENMAFPTNCKEQLLNVITRYFVNHIYQRT